MPRAEIAPEQIRASIVGHGLSADIPNRLLGHPALTLAQWTAEHVAAFRN